MHSAPSPVPDSRGTTWLILAACVALSFAGLGRSLWAPDEPREAEISREMWLAPGVLPTLNGDVFIEKPPLYYWAVAGAFGLTGGPTAAVARSVSGLAGALTLLLVFAWGRRASSETTGLIAVVLLATSFQFVLSTHWVLIDPLLMLFTTIAAWSGWALLGGAGWRGAVVFYASIAAALWTKGPIGPVLLGAGLLAHCTLERRIPWRRFHLGVGLPAMVLAVAGLAGAIYAAGGWPVLREWAWVNQLLRLTHPQGTGHARPLPYYLWTVPFAALPWIVPLVGALRPRRRSPNEPATALRRYCGAMTIGMLVILSVSATKRGIYLMPVLPLLFMVLAVDVEQWWVARREDRTLGRGWWVQAAVLIPYVLLPPVAVMVYLHRSTPLALVCLALALAGSGAVFVVRRRGPAAGLEVLAACAVLGAVQLLVLVPPALEPKKDLEPFVRWVDGQLPPDVPVYAIGGDETLRAMVNFVSGRRVVAVDRTKLVSQAGDRPDGEDFVVVQGRDSSIDPGTPYALVRRQTFGAGRVLALWEAQTAAPEAMLLPRSPARRAPSPDADSIGVHGR